MMIKLKQVWEKLLLIELTNKTRFLIILIMLIITVLLNYFICIKPVWHDIRISQFNLAQQQKNYIFLCQQVEALPLLNKEYQQNKKILNTEQPQFIAAQLFAKATRLAELHHLKVIVLEPDEPSETVAFQQHSFHLIMEGNFFEFVSFFQHFSQLNPLSKIDKLKLAAMNETPEPPKILHLDSEVIVYYAKN